MSWHDPEVNYYARLEDLIDQNRPLTEVFRAWPFWYYIQEDRWPDLMRLLGVQYDPSRNRPYWVDFEGAVIYRLPHHFVTSEKVECYEVEQSIFVPDDMDYQRPLLPQRPLRL